MTREEAINIMKVIVHMLEEKYDTDRVEDAVEMAIQALEQEPCEDAISRQAVLEGLSSIAKAKARSDEQKALMGRVMFFTEHLPPVNPQPKAGHCKDCQYFQHDSVAIVDGVPLIVAHEICSRWGEGCKTKEYGYCFLFEPQERNGEA